MTVITPTIAIIGAGHMGGALISGLLAQGHPASQLWATDASLEKLNTLKDKFSISVTTDNALALEKAGVLIFAVKPQQLAGLATELAPLIQQHKPLIISIAAGITIPRLQQWLGKETALIRCMPNMPALLGAGATALFANSNTSVADCEIAESILACVGITVWLSDEKQMDAVTALSGSGPAYFFLMMEALIEAGQELGLSEEEARALCLQTALGAARLALETGESVAELRRQVTSPGGTTEAAIGVLEKANLRGLMKQALVAAQKRAEELG